MPAASTIKPRYHHGNLRQALLDAGLELAREGGPDAVVLREASRRVGVSHNAAYRHFPDREALLAEVGVACMRRLSGLMLELIGQVDPDDHDVAAAQARLRATGTAYVRFALSEPGLFRTAFCLTGAPAAADERASGEPPGGADGTEPPPFDERDNPFLILQDQLDRLLAAGGMAPEKRPYADFTAWSAVHGFSMLMLDPLKEMPDTEKDAALERLLTTIEDGLA